VLVRDHTTGDQPVSSIARILKPNKSQLKRILKWIVIVNAFLAALGIVAGGSPEFIARVHGTSFLLVIIAASLVAIEQGKFRSELKGVWLIGSSCSIVIGLTVIALIWGFGPPDSFARPLGSVAVVAVAVTYCAVISVIAERAGLRLICWIGALGHSCYVLVLIWFEINPFPGQVLALLAVGQSACSLLAVIDFIGSRRTTGTNTARHGKQAQYCPYCGTTELISSGKSTKCVGCGGRFQTIGRSAD